MAGNSLPRQLVYMKFSALGADFNNVNFDTLGSRSLPYRSVKYGRPFKMRNFC